MKKKKPLEGAVDEKRERSDCIDTLRSLHGGLSDLETPFAEIVNGWIRNNPDTPAAEVERAVRSAYAEALIYAIHMLEGALK